MFITSLLIIKCLLIIVYVLLMVAFYTILERKILAYMQRRRGPNVVGPFGLFQAIADGLKLLVKKTIYPQSANVLIFIVGPMITFILSYFAWSVIPFEQGAVFADVSLGLLYLLAFSAVSLYGLIMGGWASNSKYAFFGAIRAIAQMISYEVSLGLILFCIVCCAGTLNITGLVLAQTNVWYIFPHLPIFILFFISALAETNRHPFDFAEAESELVSGYNTEYSSLLFVLFFLAEYANMILMSALISLLFLGGWYFPFSSGYGNCSFTLALKTLFIMNFFVIVRASYPRMRYDQLMEFCWKFTLPISLAWFIFTVFMLKLTNGCPPIGGPLQSFYKFCTEYAYYLDLYDLSKNNMFNINKFFISEDPEITLHLTKQGFYDEILNLLSGNLDNKNIENYKPIITYTNNPPRDC
jgi:NADH-quinone oxidoreductase subunit H